MPDSRWTDYLPSHKFWAMDISANRQVPVFTPLFGFSSITAPRMTVDLESFVDGTYNYPRHVVKGGRVNPITFTRAASLYDSDFYDWIYYAINGTNVAKDKGFSNSLILGDAGGPVRRTIMIVHFARINLMNDKQLGVFGTIAALAESAIFAGLSGVPNVLTGVAGAAASVGASHVSAAGFQLGPFQYATWLPARVWLLHRCIPTEYVSASDFDANSSAISLMNLTVQPEWIEQMDLGIHP